MNVITHSGDVTHITPGDFIVCGFFTPDYRHWLTSLIPDLYAIGAGYYFEEVQKAAGGWAANTRMKPSAILRAIDRHPTKTIIWLDVDCRVNGDISDLANLDCDFAAHFKSKLRRLPKRKPQREEYRAILHPWSGTMVFAPTVSARRLVEAWLATEPELTVLDVDETALGLAIASVPRLRVCTLEHALCSSPNFMAENALIQHGRGRPTSEIPRRSMGPIRYLRRKIIRPFINRVFNRSNEAAER